MQRFFLLGWAVVARRFVWSQLGTNGRFWIIIGSASTVLAVTLGWLYRGLGCRAAGVTHAVLMSIIGVVGFFHASSILSNKSIAGGQGADANPVGGIIYLTALVGAAFAAFAIVCSVAVMWGLFQRKATEYSQPQDDSIH